jgi:hypothetical protein
MTEIYECQGCERMSDNCVCNGKFVIEDSCGNRPFGNETFKTFEDGWSFLYEQFPSSDDEEEAERMEEELGEHYVIEVPLNKTEAIEAMKNGKKVTHRYFGDEEWMTLKEGKLMFEDGVEWTVEKFFKDRLRQGHEWETGWSVWKGEKISKTA